MVIDSSAIFAILLGEPEAERISEALSRDPVRLVSAFSALESSVVIAAKKGEHGERELDLLLLKSALEIRPFDAEQHEIAREIYKRYGKGRHKAALNIGDCCSFALSVQAGEPLLCKGADFRKTDVHLANY